MDTHKKIYYISNFLVLIFICNFICAMELTEQQKSALVASSLKFTHNLPHMTFEEAQVNFNQLEKPAQDFTWYRLNKNQNTVRPEPVEGESERLF